MKKAVPIIMALVVLSGIVQMTNTVQAMPPKDLNVAGVPVSCELCANCLWWEIWCLGPCNNCYWELQFPMLW